MDASVEEELDRMIGELDQELLGKPQGFTIRISVGRHLFPGTATPNLEIVLLDPEESRVALRRVSDPFLGERRKGAWHIGSLAEAVEEAFAWTEEMKGAKEEAERNPRG
ncbi:MAG: hypothetical protein C4519_07610 [Desulfobacteraceae bacterium]|nr:MAG: hypothetical protein C4519_07610 [Desulfobacteraceae bacterium]